GRRLGALRLRLRPRSRDERLGRRLLRAERRAGLRMAARRRLLRLTLGLQNRAGNEHPRRRVPMLGAMASSEARHAPADRSAEAPDATDAPDDGKRLKSGDKKPKKRGRWRRRLAIAALLMPLLGVGAWLAVHHVPGVGPWVANTLRSL